MSADNQQLITADVRTAVRNTVRRGIREAFVEHDYERAEAIVTEIKMQL